VFRGRARETTAKHRLGHALGLHLVAPRLVDHPVTPEVPGDDVSRKGRKISRFGCCSGNYLAWSVSEFSVPSSRSVSPFTCCTHGRRPESPSGRPEGPVNSLSISRSYVGCGAEFSGSPVARISLGLVVGSVWGRFSPREVSPGQLGWPATDCRRARGATGNLERRRHRLRPAHAWFPSRFSRGFRILSPSAVWPNVVVAVLARTPMPSFQSLPDATLASQIERGTFFVENSGYGERWGKASGCRDSVRLMDSVPAVSTGTCIPAEPGSTCGEPVGCPPSYDKTLLRISGRPGGA